MQEKIIRVLRERPVEVGHWVGFKDLTDLHNDWLRSFLYGKDDETKQAHRGSYKTTTLSLYLALHIVVYPNESVMYFRKTDTDVAEISRQVLNMLRTGAFQRIAQAVWGKELKITRASGNEISTNMTETIKGASQLVGLGIGTSITGKHADIVVTDDIVNVKDRISKAERDKTKIAYMELQNIKNRGGRFINTGTPWHKEDAFTLMKNIQKFDCYSTGLISKEELQGLRDSMSDSLFAANYELRHIADENALFREPNYTSEVSRIYGGRAHIDAAYGGEDYTAFTIINATPDGYVGYGKLWHKHVDDCITEIKALHDIYRAGSVACETNADKGYLAKELRSNGFHTQEYAEHTNKFVKIASHLKSAWQNIVWLDDTDPEYMLQILDYTENAEHDDAPDSAASLIRQFEKNPTVTPKVKPKVLR